jgi:hypothetical protein
MTETSTRTLAAAGALALLLAGPGPAPAQDAGADAGKDSTPDMSVQEAWANAKRDWEKLETKSGEAWKKAREEFQKSWRELQRVMQDQGEDAPPPPSAAPGSGQDTGGS